MGIFKTLMKTEKTSWGSSGKKERQIQKVDDFIAYLLNLYNNYTEQYDENEALRESLNIHVNVDKYLDNVEYGIVLTRNAQDRIKTLPFVYDLPKGAQEYLRASKNEILSHLDYYIKRDELVKRTISETKNNGTSRAQNKEDANQLIIKAHIHFESAIGYMERARRYFDKENNVS